MPFTYLVGLHVTDPARYADYRAAMRPILEAFGGGFDCDFEVSRTLSSPGAETINRVFAIRFPSRERADAFFADEGYEEAKAEHFDASVAATTILGAYETAG